MTVRFVLHLELLHVKSCRKFHHDDLASSFWNLKCLLTSPRICPVFILPLSPLLRKGLASARVWVGAVAWTGPGVLPAVLMAPDCLCAGKTEQGTSRLRSCQKNYPRSHLTMHGVPPGGKIQLLHMAGGRERLENDWKEQEVEFQMRKHGAIRPI